MEPGVQFYLQISFEALEKSSSSRSTPSNDLPSIFPRPFSYSFSIQPAEMRAVRDTVLGGMYLLTTAAASPTGSASKVAKQCVDLEVPVSVSASNYKLDVPQVNSNIDAVDWVRNLTTWSSPNVTDRIIGRIPVNDTFKISGQLCVPMDGPKKDFLQIATHGIAFNKRYT
jgi:hypothetical protein